MWPVIRLSIKSYQNQDSLFRKVLCILAAMKLENQRNGFSPASIKRINLIRKLGKGNQIR
jgi:hypothetical protein